MPRIALVQQKAGPDRAKNLVQSLEAMGRASEAGAGIVLFAELASSPLHMVDIRPSRLPLTERLS